MARADRLNDKEAIGWQGWNNPAYEGEFRDEIRARAKIKLTQKELVDIANYCNFVWNILEKEKRKEKVND